MWELSSSNISSKFV